MSRQNHTGGAMCRKLVLALFILATLGGCIIIPVQGEHGAQYSQYCGKNFCLKSYQRW